MLQVERTGVLLRELRARRVCQACQSVCAAIDRGLLRVVVFVIVFELVFGVGEAVATGLFV